jgi:hypothetical protein
VSDYDVEAVQFQQCNPGKYPAQLRAISVAVYGRDWSESPEVTENTRIAYVAGMKDVVHAFECIEDFRPQEAVRVRDDTEAHTRLASNSGPLVASLCP